MSTKTAIEFTDEIAQAVRDAQFAIDLGEELPDDITTTLIDKIGQDRLRFPQPQHLNGLIKQIHLSLHPETRTILDQVSDDDRNMLQDFETFKKIITRSNA